MRAMRSHVALVFVHSVFLSTWNVQVYLGRTLVGTTARGLDISGLRGVGGGLAR
jgi:hypothetical protein